MSGSTVLATMTASVLEAAEAIGLDAGALGSAAGIDAESLRDPDARVPIELHFRLWEVVSEKKRGLEIGARMGLAGSGVIGYAMQHGATVKEALEWLWRYRSVIHPEVVPALSVEGGELVFSRVVSPPFVRLAEPVYAQASATVAVMQALTGTPVRPLRLELPTPPPPDPARVEAFLGCPVTFSRPRFTIAFDAELLGRPLPRSDERLFGYLARHVQRLHDELPKTTRFTERARYAIGEMLAHGEPRLGALAKQLAVSERTLHRRLQEEGTTFAALLDEARRERAMLLLGDPTASGSQIAFLLGYTEPAAFFRAFKRWTGRTCQQWRAARGERGPDVR